MICYGVICKVKLAERLIQQSVDACCCGDEPDDAAIEVFDLAGIPPYNQDLYSNIPAEVKVFKN